MLAILCTLSLAHAVAPDDFDLVLLEEGWTVEAADQEFLPGETDSDFPSELEWEGEVWRLASSRYTSTDPDTGNGCLYMIWENGEPLYPFQPAEFELDGETAHGLGGTCGNARYGVDPDAPYQRSPHWLVVDRNFTDADGDQPVDLLYRADLSEPWNYEAHVVLTAPVMNTSTRECFGETCLIGVGTSAMDDAGTPAEGTARVWGTFMQDPWIGLAAPGSDTWTCGVAGLGPDGYSTELALGGAPGADGQEEQCIDPVPGPHPDLVFFQYDTSDDWASDLTLSAAWGLVEDGRIIDVKEVARRVTPKQNIRPFYVSASDAYPCGSMLVLGQADGRTQILRLVPPDGHALCGYADGGAEGTTGDGGTAGDGGSTTLDAEAKSGCGSRAAVLCFPLALLGWRRRRWR